MAKKHEGVAITHAVSTYWTKICITCKEYSEPRLKQSSHLLITLQTNKNDRKSPAASRGMFTLDEVITSRGTLGTTTCSRLKPRVALLINEVAQVGHAEG